MWAHGADRLAQRRASQGTVGLPCALRRDRGGLRGGDLRPDGFDQDRLHPPLRRCLQGRRAQCPEPIRSWQHGCPSTDAGSARSVDSRRTGRSRRGGWSVHDRRTDLRHQGKGRRERVRTDVPGQLVEPGGAQLLHPCERQGSDTGHRRGAGCRSSVSGSSEGRRLRTDPDVERGEALPSCRCGQVRDGWEHGRRIGGAVRPCHRADGDEPRRALRRHLGCRRARRHARHVAGPGSGRHRPQV